jgi:hypothetical protein
LRIDGVIYLGRHLAKKRTSFDSIEHLYAANREANDECDSVKTQERHEAIDSIRRGGHRLENFETINSSFHNLVHDSEEEILVISLQ